jgi:hypothetical protein
MECALCMFEKFMEGNEMQITPDDPRCNAKHPDKVLLCNSEHISIWVTNVKIADLGGNRVAFVPDDASPAGTVLGEARMAAIKLISESNTTKQERICNSSAYSGRKEQ